VHFVATDELPSELRRFARLEQVLAVLLVLTPALLIAIDTGDEKIRGSISAYHDVSRPWAFYVPLTIAAMLFIVNGVVRRAHVYNTVLGAALMGVILFDHDGGTAVPHGIFAAVFFGGNVAVWLFFSTNKSIRLKSLFVGVVAAAGILWAATDWFTLFWAEWVSLTIVATHFFLDSVSWSQYRAIKPGEKLKVLPSTPQVDDSSVKEPEPLRTPPQ
jgi:hypothetical protein